MDVNFFKKINANLLQCHVILLTYWYKDLKKKIKDSNIKHARA